MIKESLIICDTNICVFRTLALIPIKIYNDDLEKAKKLINDLTNNNFRCKIIILDIVDSELKDNSILFEQINDFCVKILHYKYADFRTRKIFSQAKKSINKFVSKYLINKDAFDKIENYKQHLQLINNFYLKKQEKLKEITDNKTRNLKMFDKVKKLAQRPNNLPEEADRLILCQAIELKNQLKKPVCIFTSDSDFLSFKKEIKKEFKIGILAIDDELTLEENTNSQTNSTSL